MEKFVNPKEPTLFRSPFLEFFAKTNALITFSYLSIYMALLIWISSFSLISPGAANLILLYISGIFMWTFFEYVLHRYLFHLGGESAAVKKLTYTLHGIHHDQPREERWVFMPPAPGTIFIAFFFGVFWLLMREYSFLFLAGFLNGYMIYAFMHFGIHLKRPVKGFKFLWRHHALHHHKYPNKAFGVSSILWDIVFRTMPPSNKEMTHTGSPSVTN